jgi:hypothetical protein
VKASAWSKCCRCCEMLSVLEAVVELSDELVEQVAVRGGVAVAVFSAAAVVLARGLAMGWRRRRPRSSRRRRGGRS